MLNELAHYALIGLTAGVIATLVVIGAWIICNIIIEIMGDK